MELKSKDMIEYSNNWGTIADTSKWTFLGDGYNGIANGTIWIDTWDYSGNDSGQFTSNDLRTFGAGRLISFAIGGSVKAESSNAGSTGSAASAFRLTDGGAHTQTIMDMLIACAGSGKSGGGYSGWVTLYIVGNSVTIYHGIYNASSGATNTVSLLASGTTINISSWTSLKLLIYASCGTSGSPRASCRGQITMSMLNDSKIVRGSEGILATPQ